MTPVDDDEDVDVDDTPELLLTLDAAATAAELLAAKAFMAACILCCGVMPNVPNCDKEFKAFNEALFLSSFLLRDDEEDPLIPLPTPQPPPKEPCVDIKPPEDEALLAFELPTK